MKISMFEISLAFILGLFVWTSCCLGEEKKDKYQWKPLGGNECYTGMWSLGELWWYNRLQVFSHNCEVDFRDEDATVFWLEGKGKDGIFGVKYPWIKPLEKGFIYKFTVAMQSPPDMILVNGKKTWEKEAGEFKDQAVTFTYIPESNETIDIMMLKHSTETASRLVFGWIPYFKKGKLDASRSPYQGTVPKYEEPRLPGNISFRSINPAVASSMLDKFNAEPVDYRPSPIQKQDYPVSGVCFIEGMMKMKNSMSWNFKEAGVEMKAGVGMMSHDDLGVNFSEFVEASRKNGISNILIMPIIPSPASKPPKIYQWNHWIHALTGNGQRLWKADENAMKMQETRKLTSEFIKRWLAEFPDAEVILWWPEFESIFGLWDGGMAMSPMKNLSPQWKEIIEKGGVQSWQAIFQYFSDMAAGIRNDVGNGRVKHMVLWGRAGMQGAYAYKAGGDILMTKHIHRSNVNITISNARGSANAYGKEYSFDNDCWNRNYWWDYHPSEINQTLLAYFHAGGKYIFDEIPVVTKDQKSLTENGKTWFEFIRYAKTHPVLGHQEAKIAIMRGLPDEWGRICGPSGSWSTAKVSHEITFYEYFKDYNLLNLVFANFGFYHRTFSDRLCTGTPYGPADMIPWDAPESKLKEYDIVVYLGKSTCMDESQYGNLKGFVNHGGTLIMAAGQLRKSDETFFKNDLTDLFGAKILGNATLKADSGWDREKQTWTFPEGKKDYIQLAVSGEKAEAYVRLKNSDPHVVANRLGKGKTYLFSTEYLTELGEEIPSRVISPELEKCKRLNIKPESSWLEYGVAKKGNCYVLPVFNHGNVGFPSGNGKKNGRWDGSLELVLEKFDFPKGPLEAWGVQYQANKEKPFSLVPLQTVQRDQLLEIKISVDTFAEIVVGPKGKVQKEYFYGK